MRSLIGALAMLLVACSGGDDERSLEEWLAAGDGGQVEAELVPCVADGLRADLSSSEIDEMVELDTGGWSDEDYLRHQSVMEPLGSATFACAGEQIEGS